jgi:cobalt-zinc-cadmium efflux system membrane fusion protein
MKTTLKKYILYTLAIPVLVACGKKTEEESTTKETENPAGVELTSEQFKVAGLQLGKISRRDISNVIAVNGTIDVPPQNLVSVSAPLGGFVQNTKLLPGSLVRKGDILVVIENAEFITLQQDYLESRNKLEYMQLEYERQKALSKENVSSAKIFEQAESDYKSLKTKVKALDEKLALIGIDARQLNDDKISRSVSIRSSINGYVKSVNVNIGKYVNPTDVMFEIVNTDDMHLQLSVFEKNATSIKKGQKIKFMLPNEDNKERTATIYLIGRSINDDKTINVHAHINEQSPEILPGMFVKARIETSSKEAPCVPDESVVQSEGKNYMFIFDGKTKKDTMEIYKFSMVEIKTGASEEGYTQISVPENIDIDSVQIADKGAFALLSKMKNSEE